MTIYKRSDYGAPLSMSKKKDRNPHPSGTQGAETAEPGARRVPRRDKDNARLRRDSQVIQLHADIHCQLLRRSTGLPSAAITTCCPTRLGLVLCHLPGDLHSRARRAAHRAIRGDTAFLRCGGVGPHRDELERHAVRRQVPVTLVCTRKVGEVLKVLPEEERAQNR